MHELHALLLPTGSTLVEAIRQALKGGPAVLPLDPKMPPPQLKATLQALRPHAVITPHGAKSPPLPGVPVANNVAAVICTSGSTGVPKGVVLSVDALSSSARLTLKHLSARPQDGWLCALPAHYIAGFQVIVRSIVAGTPLEIHPTFDSAHIRNSAAAFVSLVPTMLRNLLDANVDIARFSRILLGGAPAPVELCTRAKAQGAKITTTYGMAETAGGCVYDGRPLPDVQLEIDMTERILIDGPMLANGYRLAPDLTAEHFTTSGFRSPDLGHLAPDGTLTVRGRIDDIIITGGIKVAAHTVTDALHKHPGVREAIVFGRPDEQWGQRIVAAIVFSEEPIDLATLREHVTSLLGSASAPRELVPFKEFPQLTSGKIDRLAIQSAAIGKIW